MEQNTDQFGMTEGDVKNANRQELILRIKTYYGQIEPIIVKIFSSTIYYLIRFIKAFVTASMRMIMGKEE